MCEFIKRGWLGYAVDIITMGGYTTYRTFEYTKCIQKQNKEDLEKIIKLWKPSSIISN